MEREWNYGRSNLHEALRTKYAARDKRERVIVGAMFVGLLVAGLTLILV